MRFALALLLAGAIARADTLSDLKARLSSSAETAAVTATVSFASSRLGEKSAATAPQQATVVATDGPDGFQIRWARDVIRPAMQAGAKEGERRRGAREAIDGLKPFEIYEYLNIAGSIMEVLNRAELTEEKSDTWQGRPARRLALKLTLPLSEKDRKYIKEVSADATVWLDEEGWPLAAERRLHIKGRAMLVISFEQKESERFEFGRVAGRLVTLRHEKSSEGSGGGESGGRKTVATLQVAQL